MKQSEVFLLGEGRKWLERNRGRFELGADPVAAAIKHVGFRPFKVMEVGCSNGWRLRLLREEYDCEVIGIDPAQQPTTGFPIFHGTADDLHILPNGEVDCLIYGWCLYLCDREDLSKIVAEGDRVLADGGYLIVYDFYTTVPHKRKYKHYEGLFSYKMDYAKLWLASPSYHPIHHKTFGEGDNTTRVTVLQKEIYNGWPLLNDKANEA